jgi:hypothetical protein
MKSECSFASDEQKLWEKNVLIPTHDRLMENPSFAIPIEQVERNLEARRLEC